MITRREFGAIIGGSLREHHAEITNLHLKVRKKNQGHRGQAGPVDEVKQCAVYARQALA